MAWAFVCPASRGIGFYLTRHLLQNTQIPIVATARKDVKEVRSKMLDGLDGVDGERLTVLEVDVTDEDTIAAAASKAKQLFPPKDHHLHLTFSLPGILYPEKTPLTLSSPALHHTFAINTIAPLLISKHFLPFLPTKRLPSHPLTTSSSLPPHATWLNISARVGSTMDNELGGWYSYRASKAGVNSLTKSLDLWVRQRAGDRAVVVGYHPGTVRTGLSKEFWGSVEKGKLFEPEDAVGKMWNVVRNMKIDGRGKCWDWKGEEIPP